MTETPSLAFQRVGHAFLGRSLFEDFDLTIEKGEAVALLGPSGSGKTTLLQIAAGIVEPVKGRVLRSYRRQAVVFQEPRLLPWMTLTDNIAYGLAAGGEAKAVRRGRAERLALDVGLEQEDFRKYPAELSGGMRQRANVARALAVDPDMLFLDEPFSATDVGLRRHLQDLLTNAARKNGFSVLLVTHDLAEAARVADRILVLSARAGRIAASRALAGRPGERSERMIFEQVDAWSHDPAFDELFSAAEQRR